MAGGGAHAPVRFLTPAAGTVTVTRDVATDRPVVVAGQQQAALAAAGAPASSRHCSRIFPGLDIHGIHGIHGRFRALSLLGLCGVCVRNLCRRGFVSLKALKGAMSAMSLQRPGRGSRVAQVTLAQQNPKT